MLRKIALAAFAAAVIMLVRPAAVGAYGAAHFGYTHVGPAGAFHTGTTWGHGPYGGYHTAVGFGGGTYYGGAAVRPYAAYGAYGHGPYGGYYHYVPAYGSGFQYGSGFSYIR